MQGKRKIQRVVLFFMAWMWWGGNREVYAGPTASYSANKNSFVAQRACSSLHFSIKSWGTVHCRTIETHWAFSGTLAMGILVEWQPCHAIGIQSGLKYDHMYVTALRFDIQGDNISKRGVGSFLFNDINRMVKWDENSQIGIGLDRITYHTLSVPLLLRIYPDQDRQFVLYIGPCFVVRLFGLTEYKHIPYIEIGYQGLRYNLVKDGLLKGINSIFKYDSKLSMLQNVLRCTWDIGFEFMGKSGCIVGIHWLGIALGYDCSKLFGK